MPIFQILFFLVIFFLQQHNTVLRIHYLHESCHVSLGFAPVKQCNFTLDFSKLPIFRTNCCLPWKKLRNLPLISRTRREVLLNVFIMGYVPSGLFCYNWFISRSVGILVRCLLLYSFESHVRPFALKIKYAMTKGYKFCFSYLYVQNIMC